MKPHVHAEQIKAWADGAEIEVKSEENQDWVITKSPAWNESNEYRIKREPTPDFYKYIVFDAPKSLNSKFEQIVKTNMYGCEQEFDFGKDTPEAVKQEISQLKLTFDGETGKLKAAEVLK